MRKIMLKKLIIFSALALFSNISAQNTLINRIKAVRGCRTYGFFAEFLWVLNHLEWCNRNKKVPVIYWNEQFAYFAKKGFNGSYNAWEYYFEPVSPLKYAPGDQIYVQDYYDTDFTTLCWYWEYIKYMKLLPESEQKLFIQVDNHDYTALYNNTGYPVGKLHLYDPVFRAYVKENIINKYIKVKPHIKRKVDKFYQANFRNKKIVGIHLRGKFLGQEVQYVELDYIFNVANKYAEQGYQFFIATDQYPLLEEAKRKLKSRVIFYPCYRTQQTTSPYLSQQNHPQLGEDVLIEALLLSQCDHLIHTLSQVSTAVLYFNPKLAHTIFY
jgi:hypothetical protein